MTILRATGDRVLVQKDPQRLRYGSLHLVQRLAHPGWEATVIAMGDASRARGLDLTPGQRVLVRPYAGTELEHAGRRFTLLETKDVLGILDNDATVDATTPSP